MAIPSDPEALLTRDAMASALTEAGFPVSPATLATARAALAQVQDKVSAFRTLARAGVPQPPAVVAATAAEVEAAGARLAGAELAGTGLGWPSGRCS